ncbi:NAD(P)-dependent dehydrogenase (short-subunit alcohol dehydrogenase family) [Micromonospora pisi]|uniref:NAD(P)-dependent dehydrogenase (Short-subunit alcohol dehydrogenase family) n=1 Tax=Micromonospora pisi TaxID=589240 RepID=A0A495JSH9_9ACTN|nr:NAD(P)-dependent dehydrogenase (short-subunit alcohol dehydrogenase family) [Micromonospora pisi]
MLEVSVRLRSKVIVVTGGSSGMGRAFAQRAASEGAKVVIGARDKTRGDEVVAGIRDSGGEALFVPTDVTIEEQVAALVGEAVAQFGRLDGAFNNVGGTSPGRLREIDEAFWRDTIDRNLTSVFFSLKHEIPAIVASGGGSIVNNASTMGVIADPNIAAYVAAKHGVIGLTRSAALDAAREGVRVNALVTGLVDTSLFRQGARNPELQQHFLDMQPSGQIGTEEDVAAFTAFLLSDEATYITGAALSIDGGMTAK